MFRLSGAVRLHGLLAGVVRGVQTASVPVVSTAPPKPFVFQDILEQEKKHDVAWKKLSGQNQRNDAVLLH